MFWPQWHRCWFPWFLLLVGIRWEKAVNIPYVISNICLVLHQYDVHISQHHEKVCQKLAKGRWFTPTFSIPPLQTPEHYKNKTISSMASNNNHWNLNYSFSQPFLCMKEQILDPKPHFPSEYNAFKIWLKKAPFKDMNSIKNDSTPSWCHRDKNPVQRHFFLLSLLLPLLQNGYNINQVVLIHCLDLSYYWTGQSLWTSTWTHLTGASAAQMVSALK